MITEYKQDNPTLGHQNPGRRGDSQQIWNHTICSLKTMKLD